MKDKLKKAMLSMEKELMWTIWEIYIKEIGRTIKDLGLESIICQSRNIFTLGSGKMIKCMGRDLN